MKRSILAVLSLGILAGALVYITRAPQQTVAPVEAVTEPASAAPNEHAPAAVAVAAPRPDASPASRSAAPTRSVAETKSASPASSLDATFIQQAVDHLVSPQVSYGQKHSTWEQLTAAGKLDLAIHEIEQRMASSSYPAEVPAALGQAYLKKCAILQDVREQGILGMQADKMFDAALNLDPSNWEARFTKAVALSFWPASMNKAEEAVRHFTVLIQQQEAQPSQAHFAETYSWLGDCYQKAGQADQAVAAWERGLGLFPNHDGLRNKLAGLPAGQALTAADAR